MATYAIGDLQGCFEPLQRLLKKVRFDARQDHLWFAGDLVNRGPESLECLRFIHQLGHRATVVLGNHDLHMLACWYGDRKSKGSDTLQPVFEAPDAGLLMDWLRHQPLVHHDAARNWCMSHAGLPPMWSARKARRLSQEVEYVLQNDGKSFFAAMYGNQPDVWDARLTGMDRCRIIVNYLTRMRFIDANGKLDLNTKEGAGSNPKGYQPWFQHPQRKAADTRLLFGHWAALEGKADAKNVWALDTGCVWGGTLTALRLEDQKRFSVPAQKPTE
ncbi:symmetrical bis(5'-nucleosyl)-tetraphosphatase [Thalassolituus sp.]|uniref:symmetrical bis(5'-nucleosyl)-tetraphosphatase n=1 Tax=Thalassolituus sp. TaxID=2030822 RepID=UPI0035125BDF